MSKMNSFPHKFALNAKIPFTWTTTSVLLGSWVIVWSSRMEKVTFAWNAQVGTRKLKGLLPIAIKLMIGFSVRKEIIINSNRAWLTALNAKLIRLCIEGTKDMGLS